MRTPPPFSARPIPFRPRRRLVQALAELFVAGPWRASDLIARGIAGVEPPHRWLKPLAQRLLAAFPETEGRPSVGRVRAWLAADDGLARANGRHRIALRDGLWSAPVMWPAPGAPAAWSLPALTTPGALAEWLRLPVAQLAGLADPQGRGRRLTDGPLCRYEYHWRPRPAGPPRLIESPRPRLRSLQRRVLDGLIGHIPPHDAAHGFRPGRSIATYAAPHVGRAVVIRLDLRDFFASVTSARVVAILLTAGYPEPVARWIAGLCTNRAPGALWNRPDAPPASGPETWRSRRRLAAPHLPQGAPTSPALANLAAYPLDVRLSALAATAGASYTRYADDLAFSGDQSFARRADRFLVSVMATVSDAGFEVNPRKTRVMRAATRQQIAGVVVNDRLNVARDEFDRLKAILHNCVRHGPRSQNHANHPDFRAHLAGRVAHIASLNPARGRTLRRGFEAIDWGGEEPGMKSD